jgi:GNAT superfamily N-acetyltransferase
LILVDGGLCHWHLRKNGQITIREILVLPGHRGQGVGTLMLAKLAAVPGAWTIFAKCPEDLPANAWWERQGFADEGTEVTRSGRRLRLWRLRLT